MNDPISSESLRIAKQIIPALVAKLESERDNALAENFYLREVITQTRECVEKFSKLDYTPQQFEEALRYILYSISLKEDNE